MAELGRFVRRFAVWGLLAMLPALVGVEPVAADPAGPGQAAPEPRGLFGDSPDLQLPAPTVPSAQVPLGEVPVSAEVPSLVPGVLGDELPDRGPEVVARRDAVTEVFANADGIETVVFHNEPVHFKPDGSELWAKIDNTLVVDPARPGWVTNAANGWDVSFGPILPGGGGGVELVTDAGMVAFVPEVTPGILSTVVVPEVGTGDGADTVTYRNVWPGVDVVYSVTATRVKVLLTRLSRRRPRPARLL